MSVPWVEPISLSVASTAVSLPVLTLGPLRAEEYPWALPCPGNPYFPFHSASSPQMLFSCFFPKRVRHGKGLYPILRSKSKLPAYLRSRRWDLCPRNGWLQPLPFSPETWEGWNLVGDTGTRMLSWLINIQSGWVCWL